MPVAPPEDLVGSGSKLKLHQSSTTESSAESGRDLAREIQEIAFARNITEDARQEALDGTGSLNLHLSHLSTGKLFAMATPEDALARELTRFALSTTDSVLVTDLASAGLLPSTMLASEGAALPLSLEETIALLPLKPTETTPLLRPEEITPLLRPEEITPLPRPEEITPLPRPEEITPLPRPEEIILLPRPAETILALKPRLDLKVRLTLQQDQDRPNLPERLRPDLPENLQLDLPEKLQLDLLEKPQLDLLEKPQLEEKAALLEEKSNRKPSEVVSKSVDPPAATDRDLALPTLAILPRTSASEEEEEENA